MKGFHQKGDLCRLPVFAIQTINRINNRTIGAFWDSRKSATFPERLGTGSEGGPLYVYIIYIYVYYIIVYICII